MAQVDEGLGGGEEVPGGDEDPVGLVRRVAQRGERDGADLGTEEGLGGDGEVAVVLLGGEGEGGAGATQPAGPASGEIDEDGSGGEACGLDEAVREGLPLEGAGLGGEAVGVVEGEAVEVDEGDRGAGVVDALDREGVGPLEEERGGTSTESEWGFMPSKEVSPTKVPLREKRRWWSGSAVVSLPPWRWTVRRAGAPVVTTEAREKG